MPKKKEPVDEAQYKAMKKALWKARGFIIVTLIGLGCKPDNLPPAFMDLLNEIDEAGGYNDAITKRLREVNANKKGLN